MQNGFHGSATGLCSYSVARLCAEVSVWNTLCIRTALTCSCVLPLEQLVAVYTQHNLAFKNVRCSTAEDLETWAASQYVTVCEKSSMSVFIKQ